MNAIYTMFINGTVRNAAGELVAFYDRDTKELHISGKSATQCADDEACAMDLIAANV